MKTYPLFYYSRHGVSDKAFVMQRMSFIPEELKNEVSQRYDSMMLKSNGLNRKEANTYLNDMALKFRRVDNDARQSVTDRVEQIIKDKVLQSNQEAPKRKTDTMASPAAKEPLKRGFMDKLLDDVDESFKNKCK